jgi:ribosomal protein L22
MAAGSYTVNTADGILKLLKSAEANAQYKGLSTGNLIVKHASAQTGPTTYHNGRNRTEAKRAHIEIVLEERKTK